MSSDIKEVVKEKYGQAALRVTTGGSSCCGASANLDGCSVDPITSNLYDANQTGQMLAALLGWAQGTFASKIAINGDSVTVIREVDGGLQTVKLKAPVIVTTDLRLNEPRYVKLPDIMKAKKKPLETLTLSALGVQQRQQLKVVRFEPPPQRQKGIKVRDAAELVDALKKKGLL